MTTPQDNSGTVLTGVDAGVSAGRLVLSDGNYLLLSDGNHLQTQH